MSSLDRKHTAGLGGEAALLITLIVALVGVPGALYGLNTLGHQLAPRPEGIPTGFWPRSLVMLACSPWSSMLEDRVRFASRPVPSPGP